MKGRKANWTGRILRRNSLLKHMTEGKIQGGVEVTGRQEQERMQLLDDFKEKRGSWKFEQEALFRAVW